MNGSRRGPDSLFGDLGLEQRSLHFGRDLVAPLYALLTLTAPGLDLWVFYDVVSERRVTNKGCVLATAAVTVDKVIGIRTMAKIERTK